MPVWKFRRYMYSAHGVALTFDLRVWDPDLWRQILTLDLKPWPLTSDPDLWPQTILGRLGHFCVLLTLEERYNMLGFMQVPVPCGSTAFVENDLEKELPSRNPVPIERDWPNIGVGWGWGGVGVEAPSTCNTFYLRPDKTETRQDYLGSI